MKIKLYIIFKRICVHLFTSPSRIPLSKELSLLEKINRYIDNERILDQLYKKHNKIVIGHTSIIDLANSCLTIVKEYELNNDYIPRNHIFLEMSVSDFFKQNGFVIKNIDLNNSLVNIKSFLLLYDRLKKIKAKNQYYHYSTSIYQDIVTVLSQIEELTC